MIDMQDQMLGTWNSTLFQNHLFQRNPIRIATEITSITADTIQNELMSSRPGKSATFMPNTPEINVIGRKIAATGRQLVLLALLWLGVSATARAEVAIDGVEPTIRGNVLAYLRLDDETCDSPSWRVRRLYAESENEIRAALEVTGYYDVEIDSELRQEAVCWQANFAIKARAACVAA